MASSYAVLDRPPTPAEAYYAPQGGARALWFAKDRELLIEGPAGTGKSRAALEKLHRAASKYPRMRGLIIRKTRASCSESVLVTWEQKVLPAGSPLATGADRAHRQRYDYPNGSTIVVGGMDLASRIMSTEYDLIYVAEATELSEAEAEQLTTRLRNGQMPYQQILFDCNPAAPSHWLNQRCLAGTTRRILSRHEDNPTVTAGYLATLQALTGARRARLYEGRWAAQEGLVYAFDPAVHLVTDDALAAVTFRTTFATVDWGFTNPGVCQVWGQDADGRLTERAEVYETGHTVEWWIAEARSLRAQYAISLFVCDGAEPGHIAAFNAAGLPARAAFKDIRLGVQAVQERLRVVADGRPRLQLRADALVRRDPVLAEAKKPTSTREEFDSYHWPAGADGKNLKEAPVDEDNHGMDALRYAVAYADGLGVREVRIL